jgi:hypothetical protein
MNSSITCDSRKIVNQIIGVLQQSNPTPDLVIIPCGNNQIWNLQYCGKQGYAVCVNCKKVRNLCSIDYCPSSKNLLYMSPCSSCPHDKKSATRFSSFSMLDFEYTELILYPLIVDNTINITRAKNSFELSMNISKAGNIYCTASDASNDLISSTISIRQNGAKYVNAVDDYSVISMTIKNLIPSTLYNIYCYTEDFSNHAMSFASALTAKTNA